MTHEVTTSVIIVIIIIIITDLFLLPYLHIYYLMLSSMVPSTITRWGWKPLLLQQLWEFC